MTVYTPGATYGRPLAVLRSFAAPADAVRTDADALGDRVTSAVSGLLTLIGESDADPLQSREHILLSRILGDAWEAGRDLDLAKLIRAVQDPGFERVGVLDLEAFYPADDRFELATRLNHLVAAPGFGAWLEGDPLDVERLLWTPEGQPRLSIVSVAHLDDAERMFFLTMLLNEIVAWVRTQPGASSLRALLYIDEVFGDLPPTAKPPTKPPLLTLLKQARAFGFGVVLATQNPVDLDYKALGNAGTWFLGRLQTERDKRRVLEGLESARALSTGDVDLDALLSELESRECLVGNVHEETPVRIRTRWAMSYLRGPLARPEIERLTDAGPRRQEVEPTRRPTGTRAAASPPATDGGARPLLPPDVEEVFLGPGGDGTWRPALIGEATLHYRKRGTELDYWEDVTCVVDAGRDLGTEPWDGADVQTDPPTAIAPPGDAASFASPPAALDGASALKDLEEKLEAWLYRERRLVLHACERLDLLSSPGESEGEFRRRIREAGREARDAELAELRERSATKLRRIRDRIETAEAAVDREASQYEQHRSQSLIRLGSSVLGAFLGGKGLSRSDLSKLSTTANSFGRASKQKDDVERAETKLEGLREELAVLESELETELEAARVAWSADALEAEIEAVELAPLKSDLDVRRVALAWRQVPEA